MIPGYAREQMVSIWSDETKFRIHFEIEAHAADAMAELGVIPKDAAAKIWEKGRKAKLDIERIRQIEETTKHETTAFTEHLAELIGPEARFVHQGMTSSDVLDTTFSVQLVRATDILIADVDQLLAALKKRAIEHKYTPTIGRSHGIHGEPTTFGLKLAGFYAELQRTEVLEAQEFFAEGQKGSSAMPHKRNPVLSENLTGLARMVRAYVMPAMEDVALWHERDISHSSVERFIGPDATITLDFVLVRTVGLIEKLIVRADRMKENLQSTKGVIHSQRALLALTQAGIEREAAYKLVQKNAMRAWNGEGNLLDLLKADPDIARAVSAKSLEAMFDLDYHTKHVDTLFKRVFG